MNIKFGDFSLNFSEDEHLDKLNPDLIDKDTTNEVYRFHAYIKGACLLLVTACALEFVKSKC